MKIQTHTRACSHTHTHICTRGVRKSCLNEKLLERIHKQYVAVAGILYDGSSMIYLLLLLVVVAAAAAVTVAAVELLWKICRIYVYVSLNGNVLNVLEVTNTLCGITQQQKEKKINRLRCVNTPRVALPFRFACV